MYELDHIGIAVSDMESAIAEHQKNLSLVIEFREKLEERHVELVFLSLANTRIELLAPLRPQGAIYDSLQKRGPGLHHLCYRVSDIRAEMARYKAMGHELLDETPRPGARGSLIAFIHPRHFSGVLTELCQPAC